MGSKKKYFKILFTIIRCNPTLFYIIISSQSYHHNYTAPYFGPGGQNVCDIWLNVDFSLCKLDFLKLPQTRFFQTRTF